ncbi:MAG: DUF1592 domain-containing protein [Polyangiaceae bacterium]
MRFFSCAWLASLVALGCTASITDPSAAGGGVATSTGGMGASVGPTSGGGASGASVGNAGTSSGTATCTSLAPVNRRLWRLSVEQYQSAVKDLLGLPTAPLLTNRGGEAQWAFFSDASLGVDDSFEYALYQVVDGVLQSIPASVTACQAGEAPTACATRIANSLGSRAFRRPLTAAEVASLVTSPAQPAAGATASVSAAPFVTAGSDTQLGLKLMIEAILLSPSFVYRTELGPSTLTADASGNYPDTTLTPYEVATQLGFTFLGSIPDPELETAAADTSENGLGSSTGVKAQVDRLLALPAVKQNLSTIVAGWFNIGQLFLKTHDTSYLSKLSAADQADQTGVKDDLYAAAQKLIGDVLWTRNGKVTDLFATQEGFFNARLAALYPEVTFANGAPTSNTTFVAGTWPDTENRVGLLTDPSYFWAQSDPSATSIVKRGKAIHDDIICADPLPPPVDLSTPSALAVIAKGDSEVTKSDARMSTLPCSACHVQMDPYSRLLQHFGPIGDYRAMDEAGRAIDTAVSFKDPSPLAPQTIADPKAFAQGLIQSGHVNGCAVQKMASYLIGSAISHYDTCEVESIRTEFEKSDGTLASLFRTVIVADFARARAGGSK